VIIDVVRRMKMKLKKARMLISDKQQVFVAMVDSWCDVVVLCCCANDVLIT